MRLLKCRNKNKFLTCSHDILLPMMFCQYQENCLPSGEDYFSCPIQSYDDCPSVAALLKLQYFPQYSDDRFWCVPFLQGVESLNSGSCVCVWSIDCKQTRLKPTCCIGPCYSFKQLISCKFSISVGTAFLLLLLVTSTFCKKETQYCKHWCHHLYMKHQTGFLVKLDSAVFCFVLLYYRIENKFAAVSCFNSLYLKAWNGILENIAVQGSL